ncbi:MAG: cell division protein ZapA [Bacteroidia bacterium]|nr:cell division protein ZapA [Bacteroidia bacterium]
MLNELSIKVNIAERQYPLKVTPEEEVVVRQAAKLINDKIKLLTNQFDVKDKQDMLSMTALELATTLIKLQEETNTLKEEIIQEINILNESLKGV